MDALSQLVDLLPSLIKLTSFFYKAELTDEAVKVESVIQAKRNCLLTSFSSNTFS